MSAASRAAEEALKNTKTLKKECKKCQATIIKPNKYSKTQWSKRTFCTRRCGRLGTTQSIETRRRSSEAHTGQMSWAKGKTFSVEYREKIAAAKRGKKLGPLTLDHRRKISEANRGVNGPNWQGGIYPIHKAIRNSLEYRLWREAVFRRDDYRCFDCGEKGGTLNADHVYPFSLFPRLRLDINNGRTLCVECHRKTSSFGTKLRMNKQIYVTSV